MQNIYHSESRTIIYFHLNIFTKWILLWKNMLLNVLKYKENDKTYKKRRYLLQSYAYQNVKNSCVR